MIRIAGFLSIAFIGSVFGQDQGLLALDDPPGATATPPEQSPFQPALPDPAGAAQAPGLQPSATQPPSRDISFSVKSFAKNFFSDQKRIWTFPAKVGTGHNLIPVLAVAAGTAGMVLWLDPVEGRYFRRHSETFEGFNNIFTEHRTTAAILLGPAALCAIGLAGKNRYLAKTGLLALEAWVDVDLIGEAMRNITRRERPLDIPVNGNYSNTWFKTAHNPLNASGSFPSGHTAWGFGVASVIARRYPHRAWVRYVVYGLASLDAVTRITSSNHFASDTVFGAVLGYSVGRFVVLRQ